MKDQIPFVKISKRTARFLDGQRDCALGTPNPDGLGVFAQWRLANNDVLQILTDPFGMCPLYIADTPDFFAVSPSIPKLLALSTPRDLNYRALSVFLRLGFFVGGDTPFTHISALGPDLTMTISGAKYQERDNDNTRVESYIPGVDPVERFAVAFGRAMEQRLVAAQLFLLPLSGGLDSRCMLSWLIQVGNIAPVCLTGRKYPPDDGGDVKIARKITEMFGLDHTIISPRPESVTSLANAFQLQDFCTIENAWYQVCGSLLTASGKGFFDGLGGDVLCGRYNDEKLDTLIKRGRLLEAASQIVGYWRLAPYLSAIVGECIWSQVSHHLALERIAEELEKYRGFGNSVAAFYFYNRARRALSLGPFRLTTGPLNRQFPYLDTSFVARMLAFPGSVTSSLDLRKSYLKRYFPTLAKIPTSSTRLEDKALGILRALTLSSKTHGILPARLIDGSFLKPVRALTLITSSLKAPRSTLRLCSLAVYLWALERAHMT
jgi:asparagine synthetase B (glutamine-hydrolysing)